MCLIDSGLKYVSKIGLFVFYPMAINLEYKGCDFLKFKTMKFETYQMPLDKVENITANNGKQEWQFVNQLHEIGGTRQREDRKTFASQVEAKKSFDEQAAKYRKIIGRVSNAIIKQSDTELQIHVDGVQIIKMTYLAVPSECA